MKKLKIYDLNKKEITEGDVVKISNAYTKNDNGIFFVKRTPNSKDYGGGTLWLEKLNSKTMEKSKGTYSTCSWPLTSYSNNREYRISAREHNEKNATIEVIGKYDELYKIKTEELKEKAKNKKPLPLIKELKGIKLNDVFSYSWGYDQTNVNYYQVVGFKGKSTVLIREISSRMVESKGYSSMAGECEPRLNSFIGDEVIEKRIGISSYNNQVYLNMEFSCAYLWDGKPDYISWYA